MRGQLEAYFDVAFTAPEGVKRLRELILSLAVQGKLTDQRDSDEPASELLKKIAAEKKKLEKEGKIKKQKPLPPVGDDEKPYPLPKGWEWVRLGEVGHDLGQMTPQNDFTYIDVSSINNVTGKILSNPQVLKSFNAPSRARKIVNNKTLLFSTVRPYLLNTAIVEVDYDIPPIASTAFSILHPYKDIHVEFIFLFVRSMYFIHYVNKIMKGVAYPAITDCEFRQGALPLPPLAEQQRIAERVNTLMARCDALEAIHKEQEHKRSSARAAAMHAITMPQGTTDVAFAFSRNWSFLARHFEQLFTTKQDVAELRKTILQLAVMGKLTEHPDSDEPASELLKEITAEKKKLKKEGNIKKQKPLPPVADDEKPYALPKGWEWVRLGEMCSKITDGDHHTPKRIASGKRLLSAKNVRDGYLDFSTCDFISDTDYEKSRKRCFPQEGDILIVSVGGTIGRSAIVPQDASFALVRSVALIKNIFSYPDLIKYFMDAKILQAQIHSKKRGGAQPCLYLSEIENLLFPLPPLAEQQRIVERVNSLMSLCDTLEERIEARTQTQGNLLNAVVAMA